MNSYTITHRVEKTQTIQAPTKGDALEIFWRTVAPLQGGDVVGVDIVADYEETQP